MTSSEKLYEDFVRVNRGNPLMGKQERRDLPRRMRWFRRWLESPSGKRFCRGWLGDGGALVDAYDQWLQRQILDPKERRYVGWCACLYAGVLDVAVQGN